MEIAATFDKDEDDTNFERPDTTNWSDGEKTPPPATGPFAELPILAQLLDSKSVSETYKGISRNTEVLGAPLAKRQRSTKSAGKVPAALGKPTAKKPPTEKTKPKGAAKTPTSSTPKPAATTSKSTSGTPKPTGTTSKVTKTAKPAATTKTAKPTTYQPDYIAKTTDLLRTSKEQAKEKLDTANQAHASDKDACEQAGVARSHYVKLKQREPAAIAYSRAQECMATCMKVYAQIKPQQDTMAQIEGDLEKNFARSAKRSRKLCTLSYDTLVQEIWFQDEISDTSTKDTLKQAIQAILHYKEQPNFQPVYCQGGVHLFHTAHNYAGSASRQHSSNMTYVPAIYGDLEKANPFSRHNYKTNSKPEKWKDVRIQLTNAWNLIAAGSGVGFRWGMTDREMMKATCTLLKLRFRECKELSQYISFDIYSLSADDIKSWASNVLLFAEDFTRQSKPNFLLLSVPVASIPPTPQNKLSTLVVDTTVKSEKDWVITVMKCLKDSDFKPDVWNGTNIIVPREAVILINTAASQHPDSYLLQMMAARMHLMLWKEQGLWKQKGMGSDGYMHIELCEILVHKAGFKGNLQAWVMYMEALADEIAPHLVFPLEENPTAVQKLYVKSFLKLLQEAISDIADQRARAIKGSSKEQRFDDWLTYLLMFKMLLCLKLGQRKDFNKQFSSLVSVKGIDNNLSVLTPAALTKLLLMFCNIMTAKADNSSNLPTYINHQIVSNWHQHPDGVNIQILKWLQATLQSAPKSRLIDTKLSNLCIRLNEYIFQKKFFPPDGDKKHKAKWGDYEESVSQELQDLKPVLEANASDPSCNYWWSLLNSLVREKNSTDTVNDMHYMRKFHEGTLKNLHKRMVAYNQQAQFFIRQSETADATNTLKTSLAHYKEQYRSQEFNKPKRKEVRKALLKLDIEEISSIYSREMREEPIVTDKHKREHITPEAEKFWLTMNHLTLLGLLSKKVDAVRGFEIAEATMKDTHTSFHTKQRLWWEHLHALHYFGSSYEELQQAVFKCLRWCIQQMVRKELQTCEELYPISSRAVPCSTSRNLMDDEPLPQAHKVDDTIEYAEQWIALMNWPGPVYSDLHFFNNVANFLLNFTEPSEQAKTIYQILQIYPHNAPLLIQWAQLEQKRGKGDHSSHVIESIVRRIGTMSPFKFLPTCCTITPQSTSYAEIWNNEVTGWKPENYAHVAARHQTPGTTTQQSLTSKAEKKDYGPRHRSHKDHREKEHSRRR